MTTAVYASFANPGYIQQNCHTPISRVGYDWQYAGSTCVAMEHAASANHNLFTYIGLWSNDTTGSDSTNKPRPNGTALALENTIVTAPWIEQSDLIADHQKWNRVINNVSIAAPHTAVALAARDRSNGLIQPEELDGLGSYEVIAAVPSPVLNVLCATLDQDDLKPLVYALWDNVTTPVNMTLWPQQLDNPDRYLNGTPLDPLFEWGEAYGEFAVPPIFPKLPIDFNTIVNFTGSNMIYGRQSIYILGKAGPKDANNMTYFGTDQDYAMCKLTVSHTAKCSTRYTAASAGTTLSAHCEDPNDEMQYSRYQINDNFANSTNGGQADWYVQTT